MANCLDEEVNLLVSYFCLNGESCHVISKNLISIRMKLLEHDLADDSVKNQGTTLGNTQGKPLGTTQGITQGTKQGITQGTKQGITQGTTLDSTLSLSFDLPPDYPLVNPNVSVQCSHPGFTRSLASSISELLRDEAQTLIGMLFGAYSWQIFMFLEHFISVFLWILVKTVD